LIPLGTEFIVPNPAPLLVIVSVKNVAEPPPPPASLPTQNQVLELIVAKSPCSVTIIVKCENPTGGLSTSGVPTDDNKMSFSSYANFQTYVASTSSRLFNLLGGQKNGASRVHFRVSMTYVDTGPSGILTTNVGFAIDTDLGQAKNLTAGSFYVVPTVQSIVIPISGVTSASLQVGNGQFIPMQLVGTNGIIWNSASMTNGGRSRIKITLDDGQTAMYGNLILPPTVSLFWMPAPKNYPVFDDWIVWNKWCNQYGLYYEQQYGYEYFDYDSYNLLVNYTYGTDTVIECTTNFLSWTVVKSLSWDSWTTWSMLPIDRSVPMKSFRAHSH